jgi:Fur family peroxide stress response transcriptional regulator
MGANMANAAPITHKQRRADEMTAALRAAGLRLTPQRLAVCEALAGDTTHPTAQALYARLRERFVTLSRATVYNTLEALVAQGQVCELGAAGDGAVHYDSNPMPHVNLVCTRCHRVEDFAPASLTSVARSVARGSGYALRGARVVYYGLCPRCQRAGGRGRTAPATVRDA